MFIRLQDLRFLLQLLHQLHLTKIIVTHIRSQVLFLQVQVRLCRNWLILCRLVLHGSRSLLQGVSTRPEQSADQKLSLLFRQQSPHRWQMQMQGRFLRGRKQDMHSLFQWVSEMLQQHRVRVLRSWSNQPEQWFLQLQTWLLLVLLRRESLLLAMQP